MAFGQRCNHQSFQTSSCLYSSVTSSTLGVIGYSSVCHFLPFLFALLQLADRQIRPTMASTQWKIIPDLSVNSIEYISFFKSRKFFAVDDSGSTAGFIIKKEREFVDRVRCAQDISGDDTVALWGWSCDIPTKNFEEPSWRGDHGGTDPDNILNQPEALKSIRQSDVWFLVTDGGVGDGSVHRLANLAHEYNILSVPIIFVIVERCGPTPEKTDISVGISFFAGAQDTLILFKDVGTGNIYVIAAKGCFKSLSGSESVQNLESWDNLPKFTSEVELMNRFKALEIELPQAGSRPDLPSGVSLGPEWEEANEGPTWVDLDRLLQAGRLPDNDLVELLSEEAFNNLAVAYKTRRRTQELRSFVLAQKTTEQIAPQLEDVSGARSIIAELGQTSVTGDERKLLQEQLRQAHVKNREHYHDALDKFATSAEMQAARKRNGLVDAAMRTLSSIEAASFNAEILSRRSNRARRAEFVTTDSNVAVVNLDLEGPAYKGYCLICCGEDEVMSICLKQLDAEHIDDNTTDFALNFPFAAGSSAKNVNMVSSQNVCFQCARLAPSGISIFKEQLKAIIPAVSYEGPNKKYINEQLYLALTTGLATGAAGIAQIFMAILEEVLRTKTWAGAGLDDSAIPAVEEKEAFQRKKTFQWMLDQLLQHTRTRKTFNELGDWVEFPHALEWAAEDFKAKGLASFVVTYPAAGFSKILSFGERTSTFAPDVIRRMKTSKAVYSVAAKYLTAMQKAIHSGDHSQQWKQKYLEVIYKEFNANMIPQDLGQISIVRDEKIFQTRLAACLGEPEQRSESRATEEDTASVMRKIQVILFWLIYNQTTHCTAQRFFSNVGQREHLASAVLDASLTVPESECRSLLLSIFARESANLINASETASHESRVPFSNPFGASVMHCGIESCGAAFCDTDMQDFSPQGIQRLRDARAKHLVDAFGILGRFETSSTGLPEPTAAGKPPKSIHVNLHIGIARTWAEHSREERRAIIEDAEAREAFVVEVRRKICEQRRGDVFRSKIDENVRSVLPSFFSIIALALRLEGKSDQDITIYEHDFARNRVEDKVRWELRAMGR